MSDTYQKQQSGRKTLPPVHARRTASWRSRMPGTREPGPDGEAPEEDGPGKRKTSGTGYGKDRPDRDRRRDPADLRGSRTPELREVQRGSRTRDPDVHRGANDGAGDRDRGGDHRQRESRSTASQSPRRWRRSWQIWAGG